MLHVHLLGGLALYWDDDPLPSIQTSQARTLFAYLVLHRERLHHRSVIAGTFWPDLPEEQARRRLRQVLWHIGRRIDRLPAGAYLLREGESVGFNTGLPHQVDVAQFETLSQGCLEEMARAVDLYHGPLLPEIFDDWIFIDRERLHERWLNTLERLAQAYKECGKIAAAIETGCTLLNAEPWHEPAACLLMRLLADEDRVGEALQVYIDLRARLQADLRMTPGEEATAVYEMLRGGQVPEGTPSPPPSVPSLVGRRDEMASLEGVLRSASQGHGQIVLVTGSAGVGKSHLAHAAAEQAYRQGYWTLYARAEEAFGPPVPYSPLDRALRLALERAGRLPSNLPSLTQTALAALLPDLVDPPARMNTSLLTPAHFHAALAGGLAAFAASGSMFLVLDDLHWADPATWTVISNLTTHLEGCYLVLLIAFRPGDLPSDVSSWVERFAAHSAVHSLPLSNMPAEDVARLVEHLVGQSPPPAVAAHFHRETGGNPFFVVELVRTLAEQGGLQPTPGGQWTWPAEESLPLPPTLRQAVTTRLSHLSSRARHLLQQASVLGDRFNFDLLSALSGEEEERILDSLDELLLRKLLVEERGEYRFEHDLVRHVLYNEISLQRRKLWHRRAARVLARLAPDQVAVRARHARLAEEWAEALELSLSAAEQALALFSLQEAKRFYGMAGEAETHLEEVSARTRLRRLRGLARAHQLRGEDLAEAQILEQWGELAHVLGDVEQESLALAALADNLRRRGLSAGGLPLAQEAVRLSHKCSPAARAPILQTLGSCYEAQGDLVTAIKYFRQAVKAARQAEDRQQEAHCLNYLGVALHSRGEEEEAARIYNQVAHLATMTGNRLTEGWALNNLAALHFSHGELGAVRRAYEGVITAVKEVEITEGLALVQRNLGEVWMMWGELDVARRYLEASLSLFVRMERPDKQAKLLVDLANLRRIAGRPQQSLPLLKQAGQILPRHETREEHLFFHYQAVDIHLDLEDVEQAAEHAARFRRLVEETKMEWLEGLASLQLGKVAAGRGELPVARSLMKEAVASLEERNMRIEAINARAELGIVLHRLGCTEEAGRTLASAWEAATRHMLRPTVERLLAYHGCPLPIVGREEVQLPRYDAPLRRALQPEECVCVTWTPTAVGLEPELEAIPLRHVRIRRMLTEAAVQGASPTVNDLAGGLQVSPATLKSDLATLRQEGWPAFTRGHFPTDILEPVS